MIQRYGYKNKKNSMKVKTSGSYDDPNKPHAWIVGPSDRGRKSIKSGNKVYLKNGQNFEIEIYNPLTNAVLADVRVNGSSVSKGGLVIRPGERFYLDCFVDDKKKFIFKTYEVDDTPQSKKAIAKNGLVEVFFYKEEVSNVSIIKNGKRIIEHHYHYPYYPYYPWNIWYPWTYTVYTTGATTTLSSAGSVVIGNSNTTSTYGSTFDASGTIFTSDNVTLTGGLDTSGYAAGGDAAYCCNSLPPIETGRVEKGEKSDQKFQEVDMEFESYKISSVVYHILPESQRPVNTKEILKKKKKDQIKEMQKQIEELQKMLGKVSND